MSDRLAGEPRHRHRPIRALLLVIAVAALGGASWWYYRSDVPRLPPGPVPVIHSDTAPVKEAPKDPGGMIVPDQDSVLLNRQAGDAPKVEQLLPDPEPALPRPVAPQVAKPAPQAIVAPPPAMPAQSVAAPPAPPLAAAVAPAPPVAAAVASAPSALPIGAENGYRLQLGAVRSEAAAAQEWERLKRAQPEVLGKLGFSAARADLGEKGIYYRIEAGPIADMAQAEASCDTLKSRKVGCILVKP